MQERRDHQRRWTDRGLSPEEQKLVGCLQLTRIDARLLLLLLLRRCIFVGIHSLQRLVLKRREADACLKEYKRDGSDAAAVGLQRAVAPFVIFVKAARAKQAEHVRCL